MSEILGALHMVIGEADVPDDREPEIQKSLELHGAPNFSTVG